MLRLNEGGNMKVVDKEGNIVAEAESVDLKVFNRTNLKSALLQLFKKIDILYRNKYQVPLWDNFKIVETGYTFSGSSEFIFDKQISDDEFLKYKPRLGDIDIIIDKNKADNFIELMDSLTGVNIIPSMENMGRTEQPKMLDNVQRSYIIKYTVEDKSVMIQVDFELQEFVDGVPNTWAKFSHSSMWDDLKSGIKGAWHKLLLGAVAKGVSSNENMLVLTKASPTDDIEKMKFSKITTKKILSTLTFFVNDGIRSKYVPVLDVEGKPMEKDGKAIYKELSTSESSYEQDIEKIFYMLFGKLPSSSDTKQFYSYVGVLELINKYVSDKKVLNGIYENFREKVLSDNKFGKDIEEDLMFRKAACSKYNEILGDYFDLNEIEETLKSTTYLKLFS